MSPAGDSAAPRWARRGVRGPLIIGHRGASALVTENTAEAFARAARDGADGVELDVLCCGSGEVVVFHDDDLVRLARRPERIADLSWAALRAVMLPGDTRVPTLDQALEACGPELLVNVELKSGGLGDASLPALVAGVAEIVARCRAEARVLVSSFDPRAVWLWQRRRPDIRAALLIERGGAAALARALALPLLRPFAVHPEVRMCRAAQVRRWHEAGYVVNTWTADDPAALRALRDAGVDGIVTNDPAAARGALAG